MTKIRRFAYNKWFATAATLFVLVETSGAAKWR
jgi:hypothetical protein